MKKMIALLLCFAFIFLCACGKDGNEPTTDDYIEYVNIDDYTGIPRETQTAWFSEETTAAKDQTSSDGTPAVEADLPADFPSIPDGTSNISIKKYKAEESDNGYQSDWIRLEFSAPKQSIYQFSRDLTDAGYKGNAIYLVSHDGYYEYYKEGWYGAWQNGKHLIRIDSWLNEIDGSYALTIDIVECIGETYPELAKLLPVFKGYSCAKGSYFEVLDNGETLEHEFDGAFHKKWLIRYTYENAYVGVTRKEFESYVETLQAEGFDGNPYYYKLDGCETYGFDGLRKDDGLFVTFNFNETLSTMELIYTNYIPQ